MKFSVIIPTYNDWERLEKCVDRLLHQDLKESEYEIIVVDNAPSHNPPSGFLKAYQNLNLIHEPTPGSYAARNKGANKSSGYYLAFTDADCVPQTDWLSEAEKVFDQQQCDLIGGRIELFREEDGKKWAYIYEQHTAFRQFLNVPRGHCVTANLLIKRRVFEELGGFDQRTKSGADWKFSERALKNNYTIAYGENVCVLHPARKDLKAIFKKQKRFAAWGYINVNRQYGHSGLRILLSHNYHGIRRIFSKSNRPDSTHDKLVVMTVSTGLYFYKMIIKIAIMMRLFDPTKVRE